MNSKCLLRLVFLLPLISCSTTSNHLSSLSKDKNSPIKYIDKLSEYQIEAQGYVIPLRYDPFTGEKLKSRRWATSWGKKKKFSRFKAKANSLHSWRDWQLEFGAPSSSSPYTDFGEKYYYYDQLENEAHGVMVKVKSGNILGYTILYLEKEL